MIYNFNLQLNKDNKNSKKQHATILQSNNR